MGGRSGERGVDVGHQRRCILTGDREHEVEVPLGPSARRPARPAPGRSPFASCGAPGWPAARARSSAPPATTASLRRRRAGAGARRRRRPARPRPSALPRAPADARPASSTPTARRAERRRRTPAHVRGLQRRAPAEADARRNSARSASRYRSHASGPPMGADRLGREVAVRATRAAERNVHVEVLDPRPGPVGEAPPPRGSPAWPPHVRAALGVDAGPATARRPRVTPMWASSRPRSSASSVGLRLRLELARMPGRPARIPHSAVARRRGRRSRGRRPTRRARAAESAAASSPRTILRNSHTARIAMRNATTRTPDTRREQRRDPVEQERPSRKPGADAARVVLAPPGAGRRTTTPARAVRRPPTRRRSPTGDGSRAATPARPPTLPAPLPTISPKRKKRAAASTIHARTVSM